MLQDRIELRHAECKGSVLLGGSGHSGDGVPQKAKEMTTGDLKAATYLG